MEGPKKREEERREREKHSFQSKKFRENSCEKEI